VLPNDEMQRTRHGNAAGLAADLGVVRTHHHGSES
jgi:hypothetical protein